MFHVVATSILFDSPLCTLHSLSHLLLHPLDLQLHPHLPCGSVRREVPCALPGMRSLTLLSTTHLSQHAQVLSITYNYRARRRSVGQRFGSRNQYSVCGTMVHVMVLCANKLKPNTAMGIQNQKSTVKPWRSPDLSGVYTLRERLCWHRWPRFCTKHTGSGEWATRWKDGRWEAVLNSYPQSIMTTMKILMSWPLWLVASFYSLTACRSRLRAPPRSGRDCQQWKRKRRCWSVPWPGSVEDGKTKSGMARYNPAGSSLPVKKADRATKPQGKWKEISAEIDEAVTTVKEKTNMWNKSCKESVWRENRNCARWLKLQPLTKDKNKKEKRSGICWSSFKRGGKRRMKQEG